MTYKKIVNNQLFKTISLCLFIVILALPQRIWKLGSLPPVIVDEPAYLRDIQAALLKSNYYLAQPQWDGSQAFLDYYPAIFLILTFNMDGILAQRIASVLFSILGLLFFFFLAKLYSNMRIAFLSTVLLSGSYYYLQFSRVGWNVIHAVSLGIGSLLFVLLAIKGKHSITFSLMASVCASLCFYSYRSGSIYIAACFLIFLIEILFKKNYKLITPFVIFFTLFIFLSAPWVYYIATNWEFYTLRNNVVSIFNVTVPYMGYSTQPQILGYQIITTLISWFTMLPIYNTGHVENPRYLPLVFPLLSIPLIPLYLYGLLLMVKNLKKSYPFLFIFTTGLISSQILTVYPPNGARGFLVLPIIYLCCAYSLFKFDQKYLKSNIQKYMLTLIIFSIYLLDILFYFYWMSWITV